MMSRKIHVTIRTKFMGLDSKNTFSTISMHVRTGTVLMKIVNYRATSITIS